MLPNPKTIWSTALLRRQPVRSLSATSARTLSRRCLAGGSAVECGSGRHPALVPCSGPRRFAPCPAHSNSGPRVDPGWLSATPPQRARSSIVAVWSASSAYRSLLRGLGFAASLLLSYQARRRGNTEGTPTRAPAGTRGQSSSAVSSFWRGFRGRPLPRLPPFPTPDFDGKEAVPGSSPGEGLNTCKSAIFDD
jgi:hypothetical protein